VWGQAGAWCDRALARLRLDRWSLLILSIVVAVIAAWFSSRQNETQQREVVLPDGQSYSANGPLRVDWPALRDSHVSLPPVRLEIPAALRPRPRWYFPVKGRPTPLLGFDMHLTIELPRWKTLPPVDPDSYDGPRLYSAWKTIFGLKPDTMADPKIRADFENWRQWRRTHKMVTLYRMRDLPAQPDEALRRVAHATDVQHGTLEPRDGSYMANGELAGLARYSRLVCHAGEEQNRPDVQAILRGKPADDPSPEGCVASSRFAMLFAGLGTDDAILIACRSALDECTAFVQVGGRLAEFPIYEHDIPQWRETVEPVRTQLRALVRP
jgi:hypothetical protein